MSKAERDAAWRKRWGDLPRSVTIEYQYEVSEALAFWRGYTQATQERLSAAPRRLAQCLRDTGGD